MAASKDLPELLRRGAKLLQSAGAKEVYVFGSAATGRIREHSDIDLAVRGLPAEIYYPILADLAELFDRDVDLVLLESDPPLTAFLEEEGELQRVA